MNSIFSSLLDSKSEKVFLFFGLLTLVIESLISSCIFYSSNKDGGYWPFVLINLVFMNFVYVGLQSVVLAYRKINSLFFLIHWFFLIICLLCIHNFYYIFGEIYFLPGGLWDFLISNFLRREFSAVSIYGIFLFSFILVSRKSNNQV